MRQSLRFGLMTLGIMALVGCSSGHGKPTAPEPTKSIDVERFYTGRWYEIARTPMKLTDGCVAGTTDFYRRDDGQLMDRDACRMNTPEGEEKLYQGKIAILNPDSNTKFTVRYIVWWFVPIPRTYWVLDHGDDYQWFIVCDPTFENLSLFTRAPRPSPETVQMLTKRAKELGYDTAKLEFPTQFPPGEGAPPVLK